MARDIRRLKSILAFCAVIAALGCVFFLVGAAAQGEGSLSPAQAAGRGLDSLVADAAELAPGNQPAELETGRAPETAASGSGPLVSPCYNVLTPTWSLPCVFLPVVQRNWRRPVPDVPVLHDPENPDGDGSYSVIWDPAAGAETYLLQEAVYSGWDNATLAYSGPLTTYPVSDKGPTRYLYRVKARNSWGDSDWSAAQDVDVVWEKEPNDDALTQANGPIVSDLTYYGVLPDAADFKDYFYFDLPANRGVELWLTNIPADNNFELVLRDINLDIVAQSTNPGNMDEYIQTGSLTPAPYYIQVVRVGGSGSTQSYHLRVVYE